MSQTAIFHLATRVIRRMTTSIVSPENLLPDEDFIVLGETDPVDLSAHLKVDIDGTLSAATLQEIDDADVDPVLVTEKLRRRLIAMRAARQAVASMDPAVDNVRSMIGLIRDYIRFLD